jgi:PD-(D/E)XK nuclease superfamily
MSGPVLIRTSERSAFRNCRWAWNLSYNEELRQRRDAPVLRFGTLIHEALAEYYPKGRKRGANPVKTFKKAYDRSVLEAGEFAVWAETEDAEGAWEVVDNEQWVDARDLGIEMLEMYVEFYKNDPDWEVIATEQPFKWPVRHPRTGRILFYYVGIVDLVVRQISTGRIFVIDHKTTGAINLKALGLNEQAGAYWTFGTQWLKKEGHIRPDVFDDLSGLVFNFLRRARRDPRPRNAEGQSLNKDGSVSKRQQAPLFHREPTWRTQHDREQVTKRALNDWREMQMALRGDLPIDKQPGFFNCRSCQWLDACELHETGHDHETFLAQTTERWDPYAAHEIRDDEQR